MIPELIDVGSPAPWPVLPPGIHTATMFEIEERFATTPHRKSLFKGFERAVAALRLAGCQTIYLDGSFVTGKPHPGDYDGCWDVTGVDVNLLDPVLLNFENKREAQKLKYHGELFIARMPGSAGMTFLELFQNEKFSAQKKGIIQIQFAQIGGPTS